MLAVFCNFCYAAALVTLSVSPRLPQTPSQLSDSSLHAAFYAGHALLLLWLTLLIMEPIRAAIATWFLSTATGLVLEILQGLGGVRHAEFRDALANATGAAFAVLLILATRLVVDARRVAS